MANWRNGALCAVVVVVVGITVCSAQVPRWGKCPDVPVQANFQLDRYLGTWYEYERFFAIFEMGSVCAQANYSLKADGHVKVLNRGYQPKTGTFDEVEGDAVQDAKEPGKLGVQFYKLQPRAPYWVLATDYDSFALVWSCTDLLVAHSEITWILTRKRGVLDSNLEMRLFSMLKGFDIDPSKFSRTNQTDCPL